MACSPAVAHLIFLYLFPGAHHGAVQQVRRGAATGAVRRGYGEPSITSPLQLPFNVFAASLQLRSCPSGGWCGATVALPLWSLAACFLCMFAQAWSVLCRESSYVTAFLRSCPPTPPPQVLKKHTTLLKPRRCCAGLVLKVCAQNAAAANNCQDTTPLFHNGSREMCLSWCKPASCLRRVLLQDLGQAPHTHIHSFAGCSTEPKPIGVRPLLRE